MCAGKSLTWIKSCTSYNQTFTSFTIECFLVDKSTTSATSTNSNSNSNVFLFEVFDAHSMATVSNITSSSPRVTLTGLPSSADFIIHVLAVGGVGGAAGGHQPYITEAFTLRTGEKQVAASIGLESRNPIG
jgi:hypothetical protein